MLVAMLLGVKEIQIFSETERFFFQFSLVLFCWRCVIFFISEEEIDW